MSGVVFNKQVILILRSCSWSNQCHKLFSLLVNSVHLITCRTHFLNIKTPNFAPFILERIQANVHSKHVYRKWPIPPLHTWPQPPHRPPSRARHQLRLRPSLILVCHERACSHWTLAQSPHIRFLTNKGP